MQSLSMFATLASTFEQQMKQIEEVRTAAFDAALAAIAASGEVAVITIYGYTPGFNDGEPCEHSQTVSVGIDEHGYDDLFEYGQLNYPDWLVDEDLHPLVEDNPSADLNSIVHQIIAPEIDKQKGTDYYVIWTFKDGQVTKDEGDYDCGY